MRAASRRTIHGATATLCLGAILATGCGSGARLEKQIADLRQELVRVHNDNDRLEERLSALEAEQTARARQQARDGKPAPATHPPLKVVRLEPEEAVASEPESTVVTAAQLASPDPTNKDQDSAPRPMIKGTGQKVFSTHSGAPSAPETSAKPASARGGS
jgi:hypothetical protein